MKKLLYLSGTASVARGLSNYIDALVEKQISAAFREWMPMDISFLSSYADILSFVLVLVLTGECASHMKHLFMVFRYTRKMVYEFSLYCCFYLEKKTKYRLGYSFTSSQFQ